MVLRFQSSRAIPLAFYLQSSFPCGICPQRVWQPHCNRHWPRKKGFLSPVRKLEGTNRQASFSTRRLTSSSDRWRKQATADTGKIGGDSKCIQYTHSYIHRHTYIFNHLWSRIIEVTPNADQKWRPKKYSFVYVLKNRLTCLVCKDPLVLSEITHKQRWRTSYYKRINLSFTWRFV